MDADLVSADSHVVEPATLWTDRLDRSLRARAPRVIEGHDGRPGFYFVCEDAPTLGIGAFSGADIDPEQLPAQFSRGYERVRPGGYDPAARLPDMERDGVRAEVLYPSLGMSLFRIRDPHLQSACFRAYNDWLADFCAGAPGRLVGVALIALADVAAGVAELERCARRGLRGAMIWSASPDDLPYGAPQFEPFFAAAEESRMPVSLHLGTGAVPVTGTGGDMSVAYMLTHHAAQRSIAQLIFGGVLERHPGLSVVSVENDIGWIPHYLERLDHAGEKFRAFQGTRLSLRPSDYFRRQVAATFQEDRIGIRLRDVIGVATLLWASDYPHTDSTWPRSREVIARDLGDVPAAERDEITRHNAARLYGLEQIQ
jgi:predicted TIM-barrel fold metal-dependent hydrolase